MNDSGASYVIKLGGATDADGTVPLSVGSNIITVEVTAEDTTTTQTYTVTVTRAVPPSTDATLKALSLSGLSLGTFASGTTSYSAQVANSVSQTTVTPTVNDLGASYVIKLDGVTDVDATVILSVGNNVITVEVTAEDTTTSQTYTVTVTRAVLPNSELSSDATLRALTLSGMDFGIFDSTTTSYTTTVVNSVSQTAVNATVNHSGASYVIKLGGVTDAGRNSLTERGQQRRHRRGDRRGRQHLSDIYSHRHPRRTALDGRHPQGPDVERDGLRYIRLDDHFIHNHCRKQCVPDGG